jgi:2-oxoglutarate ferredoxin oxidoreductase subunit beta
MAKKEILKRDDFNSEHNCTWCPGCGNFAIWYMLKQALLELGYKPHEVVIVYGVGCAGNGSNFTDVYAFHGLHGRALPVAQGIKLANSGLKVIVMGGDGDGLAIGIGHFIHACRRNIDLTYIVHDNQIYGLTTGQTSPRSDKGTISKTTPEGSIENPVNPMSLAILSGSTFVARSFSGSPHHLKDTLKSAIAHNGFSFVDVLQPCVTFNKVNTYAWYNSKIYNLNDNPSYNFSSQTSALTKSLEWGDKIPLGVFYKIQAETYEEQLDIKLPIGLAKNSTPVDIRDLLKEFKV